MKVANVDDNSDGNKVMTVVDIESDADDGGDNNNWDEMKLVQEPVRRWKIQ